MLSFEGIDHVSFNVADPARSADWYGKILGLKRRHQEAWGDRPLFLGVGTSGLALFERAAPGEGAPADATAPAAEHVAFRVDRENFTRVRAILERHGIAVRFADYGISRSLHFQDLDGHRLEVTTYEVQEATDGSLAGTRPVS